MGEDRGLVTAIRSYYLMIDIEEGETPELPWIKTSWPIRLLRSVRNEGLVAYSTPWTLDRLARLRRSL